MKFLYLAAVAIFTISTANITHAATKTVTINWNTSGQTEDIQNYRMIYSYSNDMSNPIEACETTDNTANTLTCEGIEITSENVYFRIVATTTQTTVGSNIQQVTIPISTISMVQDFQLVTPNYNSPPEPLSDIFDDFSTDTSAHYSFISGSMFIQNSTAHGEAWKRTISYHNTSLGKADQTVSATCSFTSRDYAGVAARINPSSQSGYFASITTSGVTLWSFSGTTARWLAASSETFSSPAKLELIVIGSNLVVKVNDIAKITTTNNTYSSGNYCGPVLNRGMDNSDITLDNFRGAAQ